tara:strand:+ start:376 stop:639 length:264 start_codon:yes stop_codon:yes gene_type:complete
MQESKLSKEIYQDLYDRNSRGLNKYGHLLDDNNYQDMLQHAYEEALDLAQYLKKEIGNKNTILKLIKKYPNDQNLGAAVRSHFQSKK